LMVDECLEVGIKGWIELVTLIDLYNPSRTHIVLLFGYEPFGVINVSIVSPLFSKDATNTLKRR
jgi:hypothetical protein